MADIHLEYARLYLGSGHRLRATEWLANANEMIKDMRYHRRSKEVDELEQEIDRKA